MAEQSKPLPYKSTTTYFTEQGLDTWLVAQLRASPSRPEWDFSIYQGLKDTKIPWQGSLKEMIELIRLGLVYKDKKEKPCETQPASTQKTLDSEQAQQGTSEIP